jgi:hypothetical protein
LVYIYAARWRRRALAGPATCGQRHGAQREQCESNSVLHQLLSGPVVPASPPG